MCGLAGIFGDGARNAALLTAMAEAIAHRGPDDEGIWADEEAAIGLAHRRLSILDLSPMGHQPMASADGRFVIAYNGELYNHLAIRAELQAKRQIEWRGHSDTETLIEAIAEWGLADALERALAMPREERVARWRSLLDNVTRQDVIWWRNRFITALAMTGDETG